ncbi:MAG TPA: hypothetical protein VOA87_08670, partial [Thermoanaerobaculia bacterium]|nr:hypothetical protein [Thermoanaerobaculia bacterium]
SPAPTLKATHPPYGTMKPMTERFPFRPWVRGTSRRAMIWGVGAVMALGAVVWLAQEDERGAWGRAFGVLLVYGVLFWGSLFKIWWTAGRPAVELDDAGFAYQPLHTFRPRRIPFARVLSCGPRAGTEALRLVVDKGGVRREFFLNLAVVKGQHRFVELLGKGLERAGLAPVAGKEKTWRRPGWTGDQVVGVGG